MVGSICHLSIYGFFKGFLYAACIPLRTIGESLFYFSGHPGELGTWGWVWRCVHAQLLRFRALFLPIVSEGNDRHVFTGHGAEVLKGPVGINTVEIIARGETKAESLWKCLRPETFWWSRARTMGTNCLMRYMHTAITLNGDCKMKHYVSQEKGKCKLILLLFRCKCLSRLVVFKVCDTTIICFIIIHECGECLELSGWLKWPEEIPQLQLPPSLFNISHSWPDRGSGCRTKTLSKMRW